MYLGTKKWAGPEVMELELPAVVLELEETASRSEDAGVKKYDLLKRKCEEYEEVSSGIVVWGTGNGT